MADPSVVALIPTWADLTMMARLTLAFILGGVIGFERGSIDRPAGLRTHMLVAAGSAAFTLASIYAFAGEGTVRDPARIAAQIVTGIGFLGAGTILRTSSTVSGLTTAASIWLVASIGLLVGAGLYWVALFATAGGFVTLRWAGHLQRRRLSQLGEPSITGETHASPTRQSREETIVS